MTPKLALLADYPELIPTLARWRWEEWGQLTPERPLEAWISGLSERCNRDRIPLTVIAFEGEEPVGQASLVYHDMTTRQDLSPWLAGVLVQPEFRRRGFASALVQAIEKHASGMGIDRLYLYTNSAQGLYEKLGWQEIEREPYRGREVVIMQKDLRS